MNRLRKFLRKIKNSSFLTEESPSFATRDNVNRDWKILLISAMLLAVIGIGFATLLFYRVQTGEVLSNEEREQTPVISTINRQQLTKTLERIQAQEDQFQQLQETRNSITNPTAGEVGPPAQEQSQAETSEEGESEGQGEEGS